MGERLESQQKDLSALRGSANKKEEELRQHRELVRKLQRELALAKGDKPPPEGDTPAAPVPEAPVQEQRLLQRSQTRPLRAAQLQRRMREASKQAQRAKLLQKPVRKRQNRSRRPSKDEAEWRLALRCS